MVWKKERICNLFVETETQKRGKKKINWTGTTLTSSILMLNGIIGRESRMWLSYDLSSSPSRLETACSVALYALWSTSTPGKNTRMQLRLCEKFPSDVSNPQTRPVRRWYHDTVVFRPTVRSPVTSGYERNRSGACHGSLGRSNRVTFYPKKESLSKKNFSSLRGVPISITNYIPSQIFIYSLILMVVPPLPTIQHIPMSNSLPPFQLLSLAEQFCCYVTR